MSIHDIFTVMNQFEVVARAIQRTVDIDNWICTCCNWKLEEFS